MSNTPSNSNETPKTPDQVQPAKSPQQDQSGGGQQQQKAGEQKQQQQK